MLTVHETDVFAAWMSKLRDGGQRRRLLRALIG